MVRSSREDEKRLLEEIYAKTQRRRVAKKAGVPHVGIVFVHKGKIFIDGTPVTEGESLGGQFKIHDRDHYQYWGQLQGMGAVPKDLEYDEVPRGRAVYDTMTRKYTLYLDRCILKKKLVSRIMAEMSLPFENTKTGTDSHYRGPACLRRTAAQ